MKRGKTQRPTATLTEEAPPSPMDPVRRFAPLMAWFAGIAVGGSVAQHGDLLEAALRGGGAFLGTWILCGVGAALAERVLQMGAIAPGEVAAADAPAEREAETPETVGSNE